MLCRHSVGRIMTLTSKAKALIEASKRADQGELEFINLAHYHAADIAKRMLELEEQNKKLVDAAISARDQLEMFNFAKDEIRVRRADDTLFKALEAAEKVK